MNPSDRLLYEEILRIREEIHKLADTQDAINNRIISKILDKAYWELNRANHLLSIKKDDNNE